MQFCSMDTKKKAGRYERLYKQIEGLLQKSKDPLSRMGTIAAVLHHKMPDFFWTGFYALTPDGRLAVRSYQGPVACMELKKDTGVCWAGINTRETQLVPDVHQFPGHIACDSRSQSEIVVPVFNQDREVVAVLDIDSDKPATFDVVDQEHLEKITALIYQNTEE